MSGLEALKSVRFLVDQEGRPAAVQLDIAAWESLLDWLEDLEDRSQTKAALPRLRSGPHKAGALEWDKAKAEWESTGPESCS